MYILSQKKFSFLCVKKKNKKKKSPYLEIALAYVYLLRDSL